MQRTLLGIVLLVLACGSANAASIDALDRGWYRDDGVHVPSNSNYIAGNSGIAEFRNFFVFDLTSVSGSVVAANLRLFNPLNLGAPPYTGFDSPTGSETYAVFDVTTAIGTLTNGTGGVSAFTDLGSGLSFGSATVTSASNGTFVDIALNAAGLTYLTGKLGGLAAFGGAITTLDGNTATNEYLFAGSGIVGIPGLLNDNPLSNTQLILTTVPIPPAVWLFGSALGLMGAVRRKAS